jgi:hypothetical protein
MKNISQPTEEKVCEECGLRRKEWKGNNGRGIDSRGILACCQGCCEGAGCTCKETGVRRVVVAKLDEAEATALEKMGRKIRKWRRGLTKLADKKA